MSGNLYPSWETVPATVWRWPNFAPREIASRGNGNVLIVPEALDCLQRARDIAGKPFRLNSAYRDPIYNAQVGGAPMSAHKLGLAFDISTLNHDRAEILEACLAAGFTGRGYYQTFLHVDISRPRFWFGGNKSKEIWHGLAR